VPVTEGLGYIPKPLPLATPLRYIDAVPVASAHLKVLIVTAPGPEAATSLTVRQIGVPLGIEEGFALSENMVESGYWK